MHPYDEIDIRDARNVGFLWGFMSAIGVVGMIALLVGAFVFRF